MARSAYAVVFVALIALATTAGAQPRDEDRSGGGLRGPEGSRGAGSGQPGFGGMSREDFELVGAHDRNGDGWLNQAERAEAREALTEQRPAGGRGGQRPGRRGPGSENRQPAVPGPQVSPSDVQSFTDAPLYDANTLRTIFLEFENDDWEAEVQDFHGTDVEVPATIVVDGATYAGVGVSFRGASSYMRIPAGHKRSLNLSIDLIDDEQRLYGYKTLNLLNCNGDPSMMSTVLYSQMADDHLAVPKANFVNVVINGEYWGVYVNVQQFDKIFTAENFGSSTGTRWKVPGSPRGDGGLGYHGDDLEPYKARYDMKSNDGEEAWSALVDLCRVLNETPPNRLVEELSPILDIDEALWFLAFDVALVNSDGYWTRASDYCLFRDSDGRFHLVPHDMNEAFHGSRGRGPGGQSGPRGPGGFEPPPSDRRRGMGGIGGGGVDLDPLVGIDNDRMPLRSRLLAVPALRDRYLENVQQIAQRSLRWDRLVPRITQYRTLIEEALQLDTRKLDSYDSFLQATYTDSDAGEFGPNGSLQSFMRQRRAYLLNYEPADTD